GVAVSGVAAAVTASAAAGSEPGAALAASAVAPVLVNRQMPAKSPAAARRQPLRLVLQFISKLLWRENKKASRTASKATMRRARVKGCLFFICSERKSRGRFRTSPQFSIHRRQPAPDGFHHVDGHAVAGLFVGLALAGDSQNLVDAVVLP